MYGEGMFHSECTAKIILTKADDLVNLVRLREEKLKLLHGKLMQHFGEDSFLISGK